MWEEKDGELRWSCFQASESTMGERDWAGVEAESSLELELELARGLTGSIVAVSIVAVSVTLGEVMISGEEESGRRRTCYSPHVEGTRRRPFLTVPTDSHRLQSQKCLFPTEGRVISLSRTCDFVKEN